MLVTLRRFTLLASALLPIQFLPAEAPPRIHPAKPVAIFDKNPKARAVLPDATVKIAGLKAVMLGGEVDGINGNTTKQYTTYLKNVGAVLKARGVQVTEFYNPTSMDAIKTAVQGAHFVVYAGHGIGDPNPPSYQAKLNPGGMLVLEGNWVSEETLKSWKPAKGAIVIYIGACFTAGNAGPDIGKISEEEAKRRVTLYSKPFMDAGFSGYYAMWSDSSAQSVVAQAFAGKTLGESYDPSGSMQGVVKMRHPQALDRDMWYHKTKWAEGPVFDYAFVGNSEKKLTSIFGGATDGANTSDGTSSDESKKPVKIDPKRNRALVDAIYTGDDNAAQRELDAGADPNSVFESWPALHLAVYFDRPKIVTLLIAKKADTSIEIDGYNALALAEAYDRKQMADALRKAGATKSRAMKPKKPVGPKQRMH